MEAISSADMGAVSFFSLWVLAVILPVACSEACCILTTRSSKLKLGSFAFAGICGFDLVGEEVELVALRFTEIRLIGFPEEKEEIENVILGEMEIDDPRTSAFSVTTESHSDFLNP